MKVLFFAAIAEITGTPEMELHGMKDSTELKQHLAVKFPGISGMNFAVAVNKKMINANTELKDADEVAILPPFSGG